METEIYLEDLSEAMRNRLSWAAGYELREEIEEAVAAGLDRDTAAREIVADYLNRNNRGWVIEL